MTPSESSRSVLDKVHLYLSAGTRLIWALSPESKKVDVYRLADNGALHVQTLDVGDTLDGGDVLPGFSVTVQELFAVLEA